MTQREPNEKEFEDAQTDVEGHGIEEEDESDAAIFDINFGCGSIEN
jgi:hypothetical protein